MRIPHVSSLALTVALSVLLAGSALAQSDDPSLPPSPLPTPAAASAPPTPAVSSAFAFEQPQWRKLTPAVGPSAREDHTWTVDEAGSYAYLFGGRDGNEGLDDLWRYDLRRDSWEQLSPRGRSPAPRFGHSAVWASGHGVVIFAGQSGSDFLADLWAYDPATDRWTEQPDRGAAPKPRYGSCMVAGPDGRLWVSHGFTQAGRFDDTRAYNLRSKRWTSIAPSGRRPGERCLHDCFTSEDGSLVLYGGQDDGAFALADLWVMGQERGWRRLDDPLLAARRLYAVTEAGAHAYIFGGVGEDGRALDDLWRVDRGTLRFEPVAIEGRLPPARYAGTLIADTQGDRLLLFGGQGDVAKADVWELVDAGPPAEQPLPLEPAASAVP